MLTLSNTGHRPRFLSADLLFQPDFSNSLFQLSQAIPWSELEDAFAKYYSKEIREPFKSICLIIGLLLLE